MKKLIALAKTTMEHLKEEGIKDTFYMIYQYILRYVRIRSVKKTDYFELDVQAEEINSLTPKKETVIYVLTGIPYYDIGGGQRASQLAKTLNQMGYRVKYLYSNYSSDKKDNRVVIPVETHAYINEETIAYVKSHIKKEDIVILESPFTQFEAIVDLAVQAGSKIVYENIDNWETSLGQQFFQEDTLKKYLSAAHVLTGTAKPLVKQLEEYQEKYHLEAKPILYLPNAVDDKLFCGVQSTEKPADLQCGKKTFLYYGSLWGEWFDWDLIIGFAKRNPDYAVNLIGNAEGIQKKVRECPANVHFLGLKAQTELPAYLQYVDYTMLPFKRGEIGDYVSPLKMFEYIAMYTRVLSTSLPDIAGYPNVYFGDEVEAWEAVVKADPVLDRSAADCFVEQNTWSHRVTTLFAHLYKKEQSKLYGKLAVVILNYNNKNVIFKCVDSLLSFKNAYDYEIVVVDNGSKDGSYEMLCERYSAEQVTVCRNTKNGCSSGRNLGVSKTEKEYILFLDSDQWATNAEWLRPYEEVMSLHPDFGAIGWTGGFFNISGTAYSNVDYFAYRYMYPSMLCRTDIGYLGSGGMLVKTENFRKVEGFDEYYDPTCYEDTDLSLKIRNAGKELYYCPYLGVIHLPHQTTNSGSEAHKALSREKRDYFVAKWSKENPDLLKYIKK